MPQAAGMIDNICAAEKTWNLVTGRCGFRRGLSHSYPQGQGFLPTSPRPSRVSCCRCGHLARIPRFRLALELLPSAMRGTCPRELRPLQPGTQDRASSSSAEPNRAPPDLEPRARSQYYCKSVRCQGLSVSHSECRVMRTQHLSHPAGTSTKRSGPNSELPAPPV